MTTPATATAAERAQLANTHTHTHTHAHAQHARMLPQIAAGVSGSTAGGDEKKAK